MPAKLDNRNPALRAMFRRSEFNIERSIANLAKFYEATIAAIGPGTECSSLPDGTRGRERWRDS